MGKRPVTFNLPVDLVARLDRVASAQGLSRSWIAAQILAGWLASTDVPEADAPMGRRRRNVDRSREEAISP